MPPRAHYVASSLQLSGGAFVGLSAMLLAFYFLVNDVHYLSVALPVSAIGLAVAALLFVVRRAFLSGARWAWIAAVVVGVLGLFVFPVGTLLGRYLLAGALSRDVRDFFAKNGEAGASPLSSSS